MAEKESWIEGLPFYHKIRANHHALQKHLDPQAFMSGVIAIVLLIVDYQKFGDVVKTSCAIAMVVSAYINKPEITCLRVLTPNPYIMMLIPVFPLLAITVVLMAAVASLYVKFHKPLVKEHCLGTFGELTFQAYALLVQPEVEIEYIGQPDFKTQIFDQYAVMTEVEQLIDWFNTSTMTIIYGCYFLIFMTTVTLLGVPAGLLEVAIYFMYYSMDSKDALSKPRLSKSAEIRKSNGIYRIQTCIWGVYKHRGIGYIDDGTLYTRYHVTGGLPITVGEFSIPPCYINKATDQVAYGKPPRWASIKDGEEVVVSLAGNGTNRILMYRSHVTVLDNKKIVLRGCKSQMGVSGSPIFKEVDVEVVDVNGVSNIIREYRIVGTIGWFVDYDPDENTRKSKTGTEVFAEENMTHDFDAPLIAGQTTQLFMHPGAGKTRKVMPTLVHNGLNRMGRVYVTGPTKVVCEELYDAINDLFPGQVALMTSNADAPKRGSVARPIVIAAHATMLSMLMNGNSMVTRAGTWILDEAHMGNTRTQCLKHLIRERVRRRGELSVEMTATGYNFRDKTITNKSGSNYHIEDVIRTENDMISDLKEEDEDKFIVVFVTSIKGKEPTSAASLSRALAHRHPILLSRETFHTNYLKVRNLEKGVVLTTDISECGANFNADKVYDFQKSPKPVNFHGNTEYENILIDKGQRTQRRGRVGRRKEGVYISPAYDLPDMDVNRVEHKDTKLFCRSLGIPMDDVHPKEAYGDKKLTPPQLAVWMDLSEDSMESPLTVDLLIDHEGRARKGSDFESKLLEWSGGDHASYKYGQYEFTTDFWDARDNAILLALAAKSGKLGNEPLAKHDKLIDKTTKTVTKYKNRALTWLTTPSEAKFEPVSTDTATSYNMEQPRYVPPAVC